MIEFAFLIGLVVLLMLGGNALVAYSIGVPPAVCLWWRAAQFYNRRKKA